MKIVRQVLERKGHNVWSIRSDANLQAAIKEMVDREVGSLLVIDDGNPIGILTERHCIQMLTKQNSSASEAYVRDAMEKRFLYARPEQSLEECMAVMTEKRVRHLPVMQEDQLIGIISIGDLVKGIIADHKFVIEELVHYIVGEAELRHPDQLL